MSKIEWTGRTWNPVVGCTPVSAGCKHCYAARMSERLATIAGTADLYGGLTRRLNGGQVQFTGVLRMNEKVLLKPLRVKKESVWFVNSMSDLFHESLSVDEIMKVFSVMSLSYRHTFQVLTKRPERMKQILDQNLEDFWMKVFVVNCEMSYVIKNPYEAHGVFGLNLLKNVWLGTSVENQATAAERIPHLLATPAAVRFLSMEPLLGPVDLSQIEGAERLDWIIVGGESGPGSRPMHPFWARDVMHFCRLHGIPFFFKQWGNWAAAVRHPDAKRKSLFTFDDGIVVANVGKKRAGRMLHAHLYDAMPPLYQHVNTNEHGTPV